MKAVVAIVMLLVALGLMAGLLLLMLLVKRKLDERAGWLCPDCGRPFGKEAVAWPKGWYGDIRWLDRWFPAPDGPLLRCTRCEKEYRFTNEGQFVGDQEVAVKD